MPANLAAAVVGNPIAHSLSPLIHGAWLQAAGLDLSYGAFCPAPYGLAALVQRQKSRLRGLNITLPFKEEALALADEATPTARRAGAANLLTFGEAGQVRADNTDGTGLMQALADAGFEPQAGPAVILGAGGAARGAMAALIEAGSPEVRIVNRTLQRAQLLVRGEARARAFGGGRAKEALEGAALLVNATSLGMQGHPPLPLDISPLGPEAVVMDMVYRPLETRLLAAARSRGLRTADGLSMLIGQARPSFEAFFGRPPPDTIDIRALCVAVMEAQP